MKKSNVKIENDKIIFSREVLDYFNSIRTEENSIWIDKYFEVLSDIFNINSDKFNIHHIRPCFTFKINSYTLRKDSEKSADKFNGNLIKLSIYNHFFAHFYLWKIFNTRDSKVAFQRMCGQKKYIDNLTENELKEIARLKEECTKKNQTEEERKLKNKEYNCFHKKEQNEWRKRNEQKLKEYNKSHYQKNKEQIKEYKHEWYENNKEQLSIKRNEYYNKNKEKILKQQKEYVELNKEKISENRRNYYYSHKEELSKKKSEYYYTHKEQKKKRDRKYESQMCYDPKKDNFWTVKTLGQRKYRHKEEYKDVIIANCIIK
jgi:hypothetical protein